MSPSCFVCSLKLYSLVGWKCEGVCFCFFNKSSGINTCCSFVPCGTVDKLNCVVKSTGASEKGARAGLWAVPQRTIH